MGKGLSVSARTMNCRGKLLDLTRPIVMGIVNITPDSFYDGGRFREANSILSTIERFVKEGARIIDIGAVSSRPGAIEVSATEEIERLAHIAKEVIQLFPDVIFSIDTTHLETARYVLDSGWHMINDISGGGENKEMWSLAMQKKAGYVMMHMQGNPQTMQLEPNYEDVTQDILRYFIDEVQKADQMGFYDYCIDPGFGFGKTVEQNYQLLKNLHVLDMLDKPLLAGMSRKSMIYKPLDVGPADALNGTTALHMVALQQGASILRVHDVKEAKQVIDLFNLLSES